MSLEFIASSLVSHQIRSTAHGAQNLVFRSRWKFDTNRGAILLMFRPQMISIPDTFLEVALTIPALKGKTLAHRVYECPGFYTYLSNKSGFLNHTGPSLCFDE